MKKTVLFISLAFFVIACSVKTFEPTDDSLQAMQQKVPGITMERAQQGYLVYKNKCANCHRLYNPGQFTAAQWNPILKRMFEKAKITNDAERHLISDYLHALSK